jgi:DNA-directed RNA polymerase specialized sigma24 family protein
MQANHTYQGTLYTLEEALIRSVSYWCTRLLKSKKSTTWDTEKDSPVEVDHPFFPETEDLAQTIWAKILESDTYSKIERIWNNPHLRKGGFIGISKFISRVCTTTMLDAHKYLTIREAEIFAVHLDSPVTIISQRQSDGWSEECDTYENTLSDWTGQRAPFFIDDLQGQLTPEEFSVLSETIIYGKTVREIAEETGISKSSVERFIQTAKEKAARWVNELKTQSAEKTRANLRPVFYMRPNLWPDGISRENLEAWNPQKNRPPVVFEYDPASNWHPAVKSSQHIPANRECINLACTNGLAVGHNNLVLPASRKSEAVRFLPALTAEKNTMCEGCKKVISTFHVQKEPVVSTTADFFIDPTTEDFSSVKEIACHV